MKPKENMLLNCWKAYKQYIRDTLLPQSNGDLKNIAYWRNEIFLNTLSYLAPLSIIALVPGVYMSFAHGFEILGFADLFAFLLLSFILIKRNLALQTRKLIFISIFYFLSIVLLYYLDKTGPGLLYLLTITILTSIIHSTRAGYYSAWANTAVCIAFGALNYMDSENTVTRSYSLGAWIAVSSNLVLLSFACAKVLDLLLSGLAVSFDDNKSSEEKLKNSNRLYQFISQINQNIVHIQDEKTLFQNSCNVAYEIGQFKMAWIGKFDHNNKIIHLINEKGVPKKNIPDLSTTYDDNIAQAYVLHSGSFFICNNIQKDMPEHWKRFADELGVKSCIALPIKKGGLIIGTFNMYATDTDFFDPEEIQLLEEATRDISFALDVLEKERKHQEAEALVVKNEKRFRALIEKSADMKTLSSPEGKMTYASPSITKILGYELKEFLNIPALHLIHPDDIASLMEKIGDILQTPGKSINSEHRILHKNGHWLWCEGKLTNLLQDTDIGSLVSNFRDISDRKKIETQREFDANNLDALINSTRDLMWSVDRDFNLITYNQPLKDIILLATGSVIEKGCSMLTLAPSEFDAIRFKKYYERAFKGEIFTEIEYYATPVEYWCEMSFYPISEGGKVIGTACYSRDITEIKKTEKEREKMTASIVQHSKNLEQFASIVSHNLRAPVANILGLANILKNDVSDADRARSMEYLFSATEKLDDVLKDLNKILQIRSEINEYKEPVYLSEIVDVIKSSIHDLIEKDMVKIETDFRQTEKIISIKSYIHSIFYNIISNSIKYKRKEMAPLIRITSELHNKKIRIIFTDNGTGINMEKYGDKLFGLYKRFNSDIEGKGIGLFLVKTQVETLEGNIRIKSKEGEGTEATIELPL